MKKNTKSKAVSADDAADLNAVVASRLARHHTERQSLCIQHTQVKEALSLIEEAHENRALGNPRRGVMVVGPSRAGKSTILRLYQMRHPDELSDGQPKRKVVKLTFPDGASQSQVMHDLLRDLGDPFPEKGDVAQRRTRFRNLIRELGVEVLMFDEAHHLVEDRADSVAKGISRWLKTLMDEYQLAIVLAGAVPVLRTIDLNKEVRNRFFTPLPLQCLGDGYKPGANDEPGRFVAYGVLRGALRRIQEHFSVTRDFDISTLDMANRFALATEGLIGIIVDLIQRSGQFAIEDGRETITLADLARAYDRYIGIEIDGGIGNPFTGDIRLINEACRQGWSAPAAQRGVNRRIKAKKRQITVGDVLRKTGCRK